MKAPVKAGGESRMQEPYKKGVANRLGGAGDTMYHAKLDGFSLTWEGDGGSLEAWLDWRELWLRVSPTM